MNQIVKQDLEFIAEKDLPWDRLEGSTVLITGANGFLPAYMVDSLAYLNKYKLSDKLRIIALVRNLDRARQRFYHYASGEIEFIEQDVCQPLKVTDKVDYVIHAASQASPKYYGVDPVGTSCPNVIGTHNLLEFSRKNAVNGFLFFSSGEIYGEVPPDKLPVSEEFFGWINPLHLRSCYAESKRMGENMCVSWHHQHGIPSKIIRPFHTYGPCMRLDDGRVFSDFVADIVNRRNIVINSDGTARRSFCYIADATAAFFSVLLQGKPGEAYNVGNSQCEVSIKKLADDLVDLFPEYGLKVVMNGDVKDGQYLKSNISRSCPDTSKVMSLGWKPAYSIREGFRRTVVSFTGKGSG